jgi:D-3-phosphoglycerate dehydrogenase
MKIVITDFPDSMMPSHDIESKILKEGLPGCEIVIYPFTGDKNELYSKVKDADAILTGFLPVDRAFMEAAPKLKQVSINATGYDNVDLPLATKRGIGVSPVGEYCTEDVAEHAVACMTALAKNLKHYMADIDKRHIWKYDSVPALMRLEEMTLGIFGFGKIGRCFARKAIGLGMKVIAYDPFLDPALAKEINVPLVSKDEIFERANVISNHMALCESSKNMFNAEAFGKMKQKPIFLNMGRGPSLVESDLIDALDKGLLHGAALDVLANESPDLENHPLVNRENVIITPHAAFYTTTSILRLQEVSSQNIVHYLKGNRDLVFKLVN